jgi:ribosomal protein S18 acetylase RimI-like enzyme
MPPDAMVIRPAATEDSPGIAVVHVSSWQHAYRGIVPQSYLDQLSVAEREGRWAEILGRGGSETLVADAGGDIVGFVSCGKSRRVQVDGNEGELYAIYVIASHWSTGVGRSLCEAALGRLRDLGFVRAIVWVLAANTKAIRFYERAGFELHAGSETTVEIGGKNLPEVRYDIDIA